MSNFKPITHVIYDLDGLLLDTESLHAEVNQLVAQRYGKIIDHSLKCKVAGRKSHDSAKLLIQELNLSLTVEEFLQQKDAIIYNFYPDVLPLAGAVELTQHLATYKIPQAVATSSGSRPFAAKTQSHQQWFSTFNCIVRGDDPELKQGKPAPDIFLLAAQRLEAKPENCLVFEDALAGVSAARAAGMSVVAVPAPDMERSLYQEADQILNSLTEFDPQLWHLPAFSN